MMKTRVVLTVDTEPSVGGYFVAPDRHFPIIDQLVAGEINGRSEALGFMLETLAEHDLTATFFVEALHTRALPESRMGAYVDRIMGAGHDVQLHIHPVWRSWEGFKPGERRTDASASLSRAELTDMLGEGMIQIARWTGRTPTGARAGNYSCARSVLEASADAGIGYTSHICLAVEPPPEHELRLAGGVHDIAGVREMPVTCFEDRGLASRGLRLLQVNAVSTPEMRQVLGAMHVAREPVAIVVTHPFDFIKRRDKQFTGMRVDHLVQRRWRGLCAFLASSRDRFEVTTLEGAGRSTLPHAPARLCNDRFTGTARAFTNYVGNHL
jgi:hypothetical protein